MDDVTPSSYGDAIADRYDAMYPAPTGANADTITAVLADLAGGGRILELGIGTGRLALPLAARGLEVVGIDSSPSMVAKMREKPGGVDIAVTIGDLRDVAVPGRFHLVFIAFNTLFALLTQDDQVACFRNVADRLVPGGRFLIEAFVPDLTRFDQGQRLSVTEIGADRVLIDAAMHDAANQSVDSQHIEVTPDGEHHLVPVAIRYAWPSEIDLMAKLADLDLESRWADWNRAPFTSASGGHISTYRKPAEN